MEIKDFEYSYRYLPKKQLGKFDDAKFIDLYARAQFVYGDAIRRRYTGQQDYLSDLEGFLGSTFLSTMDKEIQLKADNDTIDDVIVRSGQFEDYRWLTPNLIVAKVHVWGVDREVKVTADFNGSFERQEWEDYVVFGREAGYLPWKIYNLVYGEHFHLDGQDFNHQESLLPDGKYTEKKLTPIELKPDKHSWQHYEVYIEIGIILLIIFSPLGELLVVGFYNLMCADAVFPQSVINAGWWVCWIGLGVDLLSKAALYLIVFVDAFLLP